MIRFVKGTYRNNGNLHVRIEDLSEEEWTNFCDLTIILRRSARMDADS